MEGTGLFKSWHPEKTVGCCHKGNLAALVQAGVIIGRGLSKEQGRNSKAQAEGCIREGRRRPRPSIMSSWPWLVSQATWKGGRRNKRINKEVVRRSSFPCKSSCSDKQPGAGQAEVWGGFVQCQPIFWHQTVWEPSQLSLKSVSRVLNQVNCSSTRYTLVTRHFYVHKKWEWDFKDKKKGKKIYCNHKTTTK